MSGKKLAYTKGRNNNGNTTAPGTTSLDSVGSASSIGIGNISASGSHALGGKTGRGSAQATTSTIITTTANASPSSSSSSVSTFLASPSGVFRCISINETKNLQKYNLALSHPHDTHFPLENLDSIQLELEFLLSAAAIRHRQIVAETEALDEKRDHKKVHTKSSTTTTTTTAQQFKLQATVGPSSSSSLSSSSASSSKADVHNSSTAVPSPPPYKRKRFDDKFTKAKREHNAYSRIGINIPKNASKYKTGSASHNRHNNNSNNSNSNPSHHSHPHQHQPQQQQQHHHHHHLQHPHQDNPPGNRQHHDNISVDVQPREPREAVVPYNDISNRFWNSVEPYCMPITQEDIKLLDDLITEYKLPLVPAIPELGPHFSEQWAAEELRNEQDNSNAIIKSNKKFQSTNFSNVSEATTMLKKGEKILPENITGPLTQRLLSALNDENLLTTNINNKNIEVDSEIIENTNKIDPLQEPLALPGIMKNGIHLEKRLKQELIDQGIFSADEDDDESDDAILSEIKRVRHELYAVAEYNYDELKKLRGLAQEEMRRLEVKRQLDKVDQQIIAMQEKFAGLKRKRHSLSVDERESIFRLAKQQKLLSDQLEAIPNCGPHDTGPI